MGAVGSPMISLGVGYLKRQRSTYMNEDGSQVKGRGGDPTIYINHLLEMPKLKQSV